MIAPSRPQKITFSKMRGSGVRGVLVYCSDYHCSHCVAMNGDRWPVKLACLISSRASFAQLAANAETADRLAESGYDYFGHMPVDPQKEIT